MKRTPDDQPVAFVEIPKGSRNKYEWDERLGRVILDRTLYSSVVYPCDYGFLLDTLGDDGDPVDALSWSSRRRSRAASSRATRSGVLQMRDEAGEDEKVLCVPHNDPTWTRVSS